MRKLAIFISLAVVTDVDGVTAISIVMAQEPEADHTNSANLAKFAAVMQYIRSTPAPDDVESGQVPVLAALDTTLSDIYITGFITPYTGESAQQVQARLQSLPADDRFTAVLVESYRLAADPLLLDILHLLLPLYYVQFFTTVDGLDTSAEFLDRDDIEALAAAFDPADSTQSPVRPACLCPHRLRRPQPRVATRRSTRTDPQGLLGLTNWQDAQSLLRRPMLDVHDARPDYRYRRRL